LINTLIKLAVSAGLLFFVFRIMDFREFLTAIASADPAYIFLALIFQTLSTALAAYRWYIIMTILNFGQNALFYVKSYFKGAFFNQVLPGSIGGDAVRVLEVASNGFRKREAFYGIFIDRIVGLLGLLALNLGANMFSRSLMPGWLFNLLNILCLGGFAGFLIFLYVGAASIFRRNRLLRVIYNITVRFWRVYGSARGVIVQFGLSFFSHVFAVLSLFMLGSALGMGYPASVYFVAVPPVLLLSIVPVSLAGWGVREGGMVGIFMLIGADKETVLSMSILYGIILIVSSLPGMYFWIKNKGRY
jgi:uncharacterized protein (TIRG00374 family)